MFRPCDRLHIWTRSSIRGDIKIPCDDHDDICVRCIFLKACEYGSRFILHKTIKEGIENINCALSTCNCVFEWKAFTPVWNYGLFRACRGGQCEIVSWMMEKGADRWNTALMNACEGGHLDIAMLMLRKGADANYGLWGACQEGHLHIANIMIEHGATNWNGGLWCACDKGHLDIAKVMITCGATDTGWAVNSARRRGHLEIVDFLNSR